MVLDLGRRPEARYLGVGGGEYLREAEVLGIHVAEYAMSLHYLPCCILLPDH